MSTTPGDKTHPKWYFPVSVLALVWNLMGLMAFGMYLSIDQSAMDAANWTAAQQELFKTTPVWVNAAFGIAVVFGVCGSIALIMRRKPAVPLLAVSLLAVLAQCTWMYFLSDAIKLMGVGLSPFTISISIALAAFAIHCQKKHWLT